MLLEQGRSLLASAEEDPDALKKWLASIEASRAGKQDTGKDEKSCSNRNLRRRKRMNGKSGEPK